MPARAESAQLTDRYRLALFTLRQRATAAAAAQWHQLDAAKLDASFPRWLAATTAITTAAQRQGVRLTGAYFGAYMARELGRPPAEPATASPDDYSGLARDGRPLAAALAPPLYTVKTAIGQMRTPDEALLMGLHRAVRSVAGEVVAPARTALTDLMTVTHEVTGWKRVTSGAACGCCLGAATGAVHPVDDIFQVHEHCRCSAEPVVRDVVETVRRPTGAEIFNGLGVAEQDALFNGRGGAAKADLIRNGAITLQDLVSPSPMATRVDDITETPLAALTHQPDVAMA